MILVKKIGLLFFFFFFDLIIVLLLSPVQLFGTPWTIAHQVPLSIEFFRQEFWSGLPFPPPGDLPNPGMEPESAAWQDTESQVKYLAQVLKRGSVRSSRFKPTPA